MTETTDTSLAAYEHVRDTGEDVSLRRQVARAIAAEPATIQEVSNRFPEHSLNAVRPRINELVRMGVVERRGKRENPSGHAAYVHHVTDDGERYLRGEIDPEPDPPLAEVRRRVVDAARDYCDGRVDGQILQAVVDRHDKLQRKLDPEGDG